MNRFKVLAPIGALFATIALAWLFVPPPGQVQAQFVQQATYGGVSGGTANAQTITIPNYSANLPGVTLYFIPGNTNTGPATINVTSVGNVAIQRPSSIGLVALSGAELTAGEQTCITYNASASVYQLSCNVDLTPIGKTVEYRGSATPRGVLVEDGSAVSRTTFAPLFSVIGTTYGVGDGSTTFNLPNSSGTAFMALDNQGAGAAGRITTASCATPSTIGTLCGTETKNLTIANINSFTPTIASMGTAHVSNALQGNFSLSAGGTGIWTATTGTGATITFDTNATINALGSGTAHSVLNPALIGKRGIKF